MSLVAEEDGWDEGRETHSSDSSWKVVATVQPSPKCLLLNRQIPEDPIVDSDPRGSSHACWGAMG